MNLGVYGITYEHPSPEHENSTVFVKGMQALPIRRISAIGWLERPKKLRISPYRHPFPPAEKVFGPPKWPKIYPKYQTSWGMTGCLGYDRRIISLVFREKQVPTVANELPDYKSSLHLSTSQPMSQPGYLRLFLLSMEFITHEQWIHETYSEGPFYRKPEKHR